MHELQNRPCEVDGRPALFHRWLEEDRVLLHFDGLYSPEKQQQLMLFQYRHGWIVPAGCSTEVIHETFALVEYEDETVEKVQPERVRFVDKEV
ncbi:MAG: hypothetical protein IKY65_04470 [Rikenellaceae bacterium]|nr:hypothetical protein [Rikenellaceae bacterium]